MEESEKGAAGRFGASAKGVHTLRVQHEILASASSVVVDQGFALDPHAGHKLLGHELTHAVQHAAKSSPPTTQLTLNYTKVEMSKAGEHRLRVAKEMPVQVELPDGAVFEGTLTNAEPVRKIDDMWQVTMDGLRKVR